MELVWAYGGASGERGASDGDIGTEREPVTRFFQLKPEYCRGNRFEIVGNRFLLHSKPADIAGVFPEGSKLSVVGRHSMAELARLAAGTVDTPELPVAIGQAQLRAGKPAYLALQRVDAGHNAAWPRLPQLILCVPDVRAALNRDSQPAASALQGGEAFAARFR